MNALLIFRPWICGREIRASLNSISLLKLKDNIIKFCTSYKHKLYVVERGYIWIIEASESIIEQCKSLFIDLHD